MSETSQSKPMPPVVGAIQSPARIDTANLFAGKRELIILHQGEEYRLRITRQEKLILTK